MDNFSAAGQRVRCRDCGRQFTCTPEDDYFHTEDQLQAGVRTVENGRCEPCFFKFFGVTTVVHVPA
jgi:hypothetical protein